MFERFTNQSRRVVVLAQEEARMLGHDYIGTEHLLLGLLHEGKGSAARVLEAMDVTLDAARDQVVRTTGRGQVQGQASGHIPFTSRAKKSLELSLREAVALENYYVGTGHLLLGLISQGDNLALQVLGTLGADLTELRARMTRGLHEYPEQGGEGAAPAQHEQQLRVFLRDTLPGALEAIEERLTAIERHLGIIPGAAGSGEPPAAAG